jgi:hypothetical protein
VRTVIKLWVGPRLQLYKRSCSNIHTYIRMYTYTYIHGMPSQRNISDNFRYRRVAFYQALKSKVGLAAAKAAALWINLNVGSCSVVAPPMHAPSRTPLLLPLLLFTQSPFPWRSLVCDGQTSPHTPRLAVSHAHVLHCLPPPCTRLCNRSCSNKHTKTTLY